MRSPKMTPRMELVSRLPWVARMPSPRRCDSYRWSDMPLKAVYGSNGAPADLELKEKYRCKVGAWWRFTALRPAPPVGAAADGVYCWHHLFTDGLQHNPREEGRYLSTTRRLLHESPLLALQIDAVRTEQETA